MKTKLKPLTAAELIEARDRLHELNQVMEEAREEQLAIRNYLADRVHDGDEGAKTVTIEGIKFSVTRSLNRTISLEEAARFQQEQGVLSATVLRWKPQLSITEFKKNAELVEQYIETKPGIPTVVFK